MECNDTYEKETEALEKNGLPRRKLEKVKEQGT